MLNICDFISEFVTGVPSTTLKSAQSIIIKNTEAADDYYEGLLCK